MTSTLPDRPRSADQTARAELLADGLLEIEPPKGAGGSSERQAWLGMVMDAMLRLYEEGGDTEAFRRRLLS